MSDPRRTFPVVIIEDDDDTREGLQLLLELKGYEVKSARDGQEGLELLGELGDACMILLDWMMPVMNGREFLEAIKQRPRYAEIPVLVITAFAGHDDTIPAYHLSKPIATDDLVKEVAAHCVCL